MGAGGWNQRLSPELSRRTRARTRCRQCVRPKEPPRPFISISVAFTNVVFLVGRRLRIEHVLVALCVEENRIRHPTIPMRIRMSAGSLPDDFVPKVLFPEHLV